MYLCQILSLHIRIILNCACCLPLVAAPGSRHILLLFLDISPGLAPWLPCGTVAHYRDQGYPLHNCARLPPARGLGSLSLENSNRDPKTIKKLAFVDGHRIAIGLRLYQLLSKSCSSIFVISSLS